MTQRRTTGSPYKPANFELVVVMHAVSKTVTKHDPRRGTVRFSVQHVAERSRKGGFRKGQVRVALSSPVRVEQISRTTFSEVNR